MAQLLDSLDDFPSSRRGGAVAVGNFDGVHQGHARLISQLKNLAGRVDGPAIVLTFDPPPVAILVPDQTPTPPLTSIRRRAELLGMLGVDVLIAYPTDRELVNLTAEEFFTQKIVQGIGAKAMVEGPNFRFGKNRGGDTHLLAELCDRAGLELSIVPPHQDPSGEMISSTRVRKLLGQGNVAAANAMLTRPYRIEGIVTKGSQRGRTLGFPTANLESITSLLPGHGVYAGEASLDGVCHPVAINIGPNPTFGETQAKVEVHVIGWQGSIYGERIACTLLERVRGVQQFADAAALKRQLELDIEHCQQIWRRIGGVNS
jgi:riboflavin kinase/FMN adenylyltransferase